MSKKFLFNPDDPKKSFDVFIDKDKSSTIPIKYKNLNEVKATIKKLEQLYKDGKFPHKRISQVAMILKVRTRIIKDKNPKINKGRAEEAEKYFDFLKQRTKIKKEEERKKLKYK
tara:strand:- start:6205 stop:6546 length:342 start_codon:yes stop_codon:yes gene_type:complete